MSMQLYYTPRSHFSRKVRILIAALNLEAELLDAGNVAETTIVAFGQNPLMKVPALVDNGQLILDSDHIAHYLVRRYDSADQFNVLTINLEQLNARAVMNGIMAAEVELILAARAGVNTNINSRYEKLRLSIKNGLDWLELHADIIPTQPSYLGFHLISMFDHLALYGLVPLPHIQLSERVAALSTLAYISESAPN